MFNNIEVKKKSIALSLSILGFVSVNSMFGSEISAIDPKDVGLISSEETTISEQSEAPVRKRRSRSSTSAAGAQPDSKRRRTGLRGRSDLNRANMGMKNFGNSCYLNSVFQIFFDVRSFREFMEKNKDLGEQVGAFKAIYDAMDERTLAENRYAVLSEGLKKLGHEGGIEARGLTEEQKQKFEKFKKEQAALGVAVSEDKSSVTAIGYQQRDPSEVILQVVNPFMEKNGIGSFCTSPITIPAGVKEISIQDMLRHGGDFSLDFAKNMYFSQYGSLEGFSVDALTPHQSWEAGKAVVCTPADGQFMVLINRTEFTGRSGKNISAVDISDPIILNGENYNLTGVIVHEGSGRSRGHYVAYKKHGSNWYCYSDILVRKVTYAQVERAARANGIAFLYDSK